MIVNINLPSQTRTKSMVNDEIRHEGIIVSTEPGSVTVEILQEPGCCSCQAAGVCNIGKGDKKTLKIDGNYKFSAGTRVIVAISRRQGYLALFLGYILPLLVLVAALVVAATLSAGELVAGVSALGITAVYYIILFLSSKKISGKFSFRLNTI